MLKYHTKAVYMPKPARAKPHVLPEHVSLSKEEPPHAVPFHCKPWVDGQSAGWTLFYGYLTAVSITTNKAGQIAIENGAQLMAETQQERVIDQFAAGHFGLSTGYYFQTPPGYACLFIPSPLSPPALQLLPAIIETAWYPRPIFLVYPLPQPNETIELSFKMPIGRVIVVPEQKQAEATPLDAAELAGLEEMEARYLAEEASTPHRWQSAGGQEFTHLYKIWSRRQKEEINNDE